MTALLVAACDDGGPAAGTPDAAPGDARVSEDARVPPGDAGPDAVVLPTDAVAPDAGPDAGLPRDPLRLNEVMPDNSGAWVDELGEADDWIELVNTGGRDLLLAGYAIGERIDQRVPLPDFLLAPGDVLLLWADDTPDQGPLHLPFKIPAGGGSLFLTAPDGSLADRFDWPRAETDDSFPRLPDGTGSPTRCRWATPNRRNGERCGPPPPPELPEEVVFAPYTWPEPWPAPATPLAINELALRPAGFIELENLSDEVIDLTSYRLSLATTRPGVPLPEPDDGVIFSWPMEIVPPGGLVVVPVDEGDVAALAAHADFEGVATLWREGVAADRVDFMAWPEGAVLARAPDAGRHAFCREPTPGAVNGPCDPVPSRPVGDRLRHIRTAADFSALAEGEIALGQEPVKFLVDMQGGDAVHLLSSRAWDLHYTWVRERIEDLPHLDRCDPDESEAHLAGWRAFSEREYYQVEGRRFLLGTLVHHVGADVRAVELTPGDRITAELMRRAFFAVAAHLPDPTRWALRPQDGRQVEEMRRLEGQAPLMGPNAPYRGVTFQPLNTGVAFGVLTFVPASELSSTPLGSQVVVVTDEVPNDIDLVGGLVTEAFQTPLSHVGLLSRNRGTPNMALADAREDPRIAALIGRLVRLEVTPGAFTLREAEPAEAEAFWESRRPQGPPQRPRLDTTVRGVVPLLGRGREDLAVVGAKAAQFAELYRVRSVKRGCEGPIEVPPDGFALPLVHSIEHLEASGAAAMLQTLRADPAFRSDPRVRAAGLARVRTAILAHPVDPTLLAEVEAAVRTRFGNERVRFRSSSNTEDLPGFTGAGLYLSTSAQLDDPERRVDDALRTVWSSLWRLRAYDEREYHNVDQEGLAMGVLVHRASLSEQANGVAISRNILEPVRREHYFNVQFGEASVANPAPGVTTEQILVGPSVRGGIRYLARSSLTGGAAVLTPEEIAHASCVLGALHDHFRALIDPDHEDLWFAIDVEFKLRAGDRRLVIKQARPYSFGDAEVPVDCREL